MFGSPLRGRSCGSCTACCTQLPVVELAKGANIKCQHLNSRGCKIYESKPTSCALWSCRWLIDETTDNLERPDSGGYVVDTVLSPYIADGKKGEALQVWIDPARPDAHRDHRLRQWLAMMGKEFGLPAIIRYSGNEGFMLFPPSMMAEGEFWEAETPPMTETAMEMRMKSEGDR